MTYREVFDQAIGEVPPSSIDVRRITARQRRLLRARRIGMYGTAAGAVLAVVLGAATLAERTRQEGALPGAPPSAVAVSPSDLATPPATPDPPASQETISANARRFRVAVVAALRREAPELRWVVGADVRDYETWSGPTVDDPVWSVHEGVNHGLASYSSFGVATEGESRGRVGILVLGGVREGELGGVFRCAAKTRACHTSTGPNGERIRYWDQDLYRNGAVVPDPPAVRRIDVLRPDGTWLKVDYHGIDERFLLSEEQMTRIALDPAITAG